MTRNAPTSRQHPATKHRHAHATGQMPAGALTHSGKTDGANGHLRPCPAVGQATDRTNTHLQPCPNVGQVTGRVNICLAACPTVGQTTGRTKPVYNLAPWRDKQPGKCPLQKKSTFLPRNEAWASARFDSAGEKLGKKNRPFGRF